MTRDVTFRLFVYGSRMGGEPDHQRIEGAELVGEVRTAKGYTLVELGPLAALIRGGDGDVLGELYDVGYEILAACDVASDHPRRFHRAMVPLADGSEAHSYFMHPDQVRGKRRVRDGDWRRRFSAAPKPEPGPWVKWAKSRYRR